MIQLEVKLELKAEKEKEFLDIFKTQFAPAMSRQPGFIRVSLLEQSKNKSQRQIEIVFESEEKRLAWVNTEEHEKMWPKLATFVSKSSVIGFNFLAEISC